MLFQHIQDTTYPQDISRHTMDILNIFKYMTVYNINMMYVLISRN